MYKMHVLRISSVLMRTPGNCWRKINWENLFANTKSVRFLYSEQHLGLDKYKEHRAAVLNRFTGLKEKFCVRMKGYVNEEGQSMVFTEDLKNMLYLAEDNPDDIEICIKMIQKFHKQNKELRFGTFVFGPVVMRWLYIIDKPDLALQLITNEELSGFFDQGGSYQIAMDLLFQHQRYQDVLTLLDLLLKKKIQGSRSHKEPCVLGLAACYHLNTPESHKKSVSIIQGIRNGEETPIRRGLTFAAALALKQGDPKIAMEILSMSINLNYITVRNLRLQVLAEMNRLEDIFPILRMVIDRDVPRATPAYKDICQETLDHIRRKVDEADDKEMAHIFEQICRALKENGHITPETVDQLLRAPIMVNQAFRGDRDWNYQQGSTRRPSRTYGAYRGESHHWSQSQNRDRERTGLIDMDE